MNNFLELSSGDMLIIVVVIIIMLIQSSWIFYDASKRNENKWLWGLFGLIHCPSSLIIYLVVTRKVTNQILCPHCLYSIRKNSNFCSYCSHELTEEEKKSAIKNRK